MHTDWYVSNQRNEYDMKKWLLLLELLIFGTTLTLAQNNNMTKSFLALGDSYTIGESVSEVERWPVQLADRIQGKGVSLDPVKIIATTGWTTDELQSAIKKSGLDGERYDLVSLLIGVNNQYRGYPISNYKTEFEQLLKQAIQFAGGNSKHVFVVSIPDYGVTPFAEEKGKDPKVIASELDQYNEIALGFCDRYDVAYFDITSDSRKAKNDPDLIAEDGLHPSAKMYREWVDLVENWVYQTVR